MIASRNPSINGRIIWEVETHKMALGATETNSCYSAPTEDPTPLLKRQEAQK